MGRLTAALSSPALVAGVLGLLARALLLVLVPELYSFDAWQRWAGRDHVFVRDWLPGPQLLVWALAPLGVTAVKLGFAVVGALAAAATARVAERLAGREAGYVAAALSLFGPALTWTVVPYQEGPYLLLLLGGLSLALSDSTRRADLGDLLVGGLALVRYEGWPVIGVYLLWRRQPRALVALWGVLVWAVLRGLGWTEGYAPSPVDYADWDGLIGRFSMARWSADLLRFGGLGLASGGILLLAGGILGAWWGRERRGVGLLTLALLGQLVATGFWIAGLESATVRMQVVPGALLAVLTGVAVARAPVRGVAWLGPGLFAAWGLWAGIDNARDSVRAVRPELRLAEQMADCAGCAFQITPRSGLGTRDRHDGCEILQGITDLHAGVDFSCATWPGEALPNINREAIWQDGAYQIRELRGPGS